MRSFAFLNALVLAFILTLMLPTSSQEADGLKPFIVAGGTPFGYYFGLAGAVCAAVNDNKETGYECLNLANGNSANNLWDLDEGEIEFAFVQSDWLYRAARGKGRFRSMRQNDELRSLVSVPAEMLTILAHPNAGARVFTQLSGRRVGYDRANNYSYLLMQDAVDAARIEVLDATPQIDAKLEIATQICDGRVDAMVAVERHPSGSLGALLGRCGLALVSVEQRIIKRVLRDRPDLMAYQIKADAYPTLETQIQTFGLMAVLVTRSNIKDETVKALLVAMFEGEPRSNSVPRFPAPALEDIDRTENLAPLHPAAESFYRQKGWMH